MCCSHRLRSSARACGLRPAALLVLALPALAGVVSIARAEGPAVAVHAPPGPDSPDFPRYVMARMDDLYRGNQSHGVFEMTVKTSHFTRSLTLESWSLGREHSLVRILAPKKEQGTATLKARHDLFTYLSNTGRTVKITSGMMGGSWMGSHFTNDDLVQMSRLSDDYDIRLAFHGDEDGVPIYRFALTPRPKAAVVWGKLEVTVRAADLAPVRTTYYGEDQKPVREMVSSDYREISGRPARNVPMRVVMRPLDGSTESTQLVYQKLENDVVLDENFFSLQQLKAM